MPSKMVSSPKSVVSPAPANGKGYKWLFVGLLAILLVVFLVAFFRAKKEGFAGGSGNLMYFFMPGCGHCEKFNPEWEKLKKMVDDKRAPLRLNKIDGTADENKDVAKQYGINGFPTIVIEFNGKPTTYIGDRTADAVYKWAMGVVGAPSA